MSTRYDDAAYRIRKRFNYDDDLAYLAERKHNKPWTKNILNLTTHQYCMRTLFNWLCLLIFYVIFYGVLVSLWAACVVVFLAHLDKVVPRVLPIQPGLSLAPCIVKGSDCVIDYSLSSESELIQYSNRINQSLQKYVDNDDDDRFGPCRWAAEYGYAKGMPCIFLKLNRVIGFKAQVYDNDNDFPVAIPLELDTYVSDLGAEALQNRIWLSCETDNLDVNISFYPARFVRSEAVYIEQKIIKRPEYRMTIYEDDSHVALNADKMYYDRNDLDRIVAVQLTRVPKSVRVKLTCQIWAKNIRRLTDGQFNDGRVTMPITVWP